MKRFWIMVAAVVVTLGTLSLALLLGSVGFDVRRYSQHEHRLRKVMAEPNVTVARLTQGFQDEGTLPVAAPKTPQEKERVIVERGGKAASELRAKAVRYPVMRVFETADMLYFVFFDAGGLMRDFTLVSR